MIVCKLRLFHVIPMPLDELHWVDSVDSEMKQLEQSIPLKVFQMISNGINLFRPNLFILSLVT